MSCYTRSRGLGLYAIKVVRPMKCKHNFNPDDCLTCYKEKLDVKFQSFKKRVDYIKQMIMKYEAVRFDVPLHYLGELDYITREMDRINNLYDAKMELENSFLEMGMHQHAKF